MRSAPIGQRATDRAHNPAETKSSPSPSGPMQRLQRYFEKLACSDFYGKVTVSFQNGKVHDIKTEQTRKLDEL